MTLFSLSPSTCTRTLLLGSLLFAAGCTTPSAQPPAVPAAPVAEGAFDDDERPLTANETAVSAAGLDTAKLAAVERNLLAALRNPAATPAARQEAAQQLGFVLLAGVPESHAATLDALAPMLSDPARSDNARLALDRVPGPQVDALYLAALPTATGRTRLGLLDAIGSRGIASAVPALNGLLGDADPATATAAARALGRIGGTAALDALANAKDPLAPAVLNARLAAAAKTDVAARASGEIYRNTSASLAQRSAALRSLIAANPAGALDEIHAALAGSEPAFHAVAIESVATLPVSGAGAQLASHLAAYAPSVQIPLIAALGNRGDAGAIPGLLQALENPDTRVRLAALEALGRLPGNPDVAQRLATIATGSGADAKAAFASLARLNGAGLDDFIRTGAASGGDPALRAVFIQQIAARNLTDGIPFLFNLRSSPVESLRLEALDALRAIAARSDQQAVIAWAITADKAEQTRAVRALITLILRDGAVATRSADVIAALHSGDAAARLALLPVLSRVAGAPALAAAGTLARDANEAVATAATAELARWPDASALPVLVDLAVATPFEAVRSAAVQGAARFLAQASGQTRDQRSAQVRALLDLPLNVPARLVLLNVLSLCSDQAALDTAKRFVADPATAAAAQDAVDAIASSLAGPPVMTASATPADAALMADGKPDTIWQVPNETGTWIRADLHSARPVRSITLEHGGRGRGYPGKFDVQVSDNPDQPGEVVAQGEGERGDGQTVVSLPAGTRGRYVWVRLTGRRDAPLTIAELRVE